MNNSASATSIICEHGQLSRSCYVCELELENWQLQKRLEAYGDKAQRADANKSKWVAGFGNVKEYGEVFAVGVPESPNWKPVAILSPSEKVSEDDFANARLIAAAPEIFEALLGMVERYADHDEDDSVLLKAQAAIKLVVDP